MFLKTIFISKYVYYEQRRTYNRRHIVKEM